MKILFEKLRHTSKKNVFVMISACVFFSAFIAYGAWTEPSQDLTNTSLPAALNDGNLDQAKDGGLEINAGGSSAGLIIFGGGRVGIGMNNPGEKLDIDGNMRITDLLRPNRNRGIVNELLTRISSGMDWQPDKVFMVIPRIDIVYSNGGCTHVFPGCPTGWQEESYSPVVLDPACGRDPGANSLPLVYGKSIRICSQDRR
ncbi:MAG TPA: hypothetical protein VJB92_01480 [Candidatus Paceibacterota bacterium]